MEPTLSLVLQALLPALEEQTAFAARVKTAAGVLARTFGMAALKLTLVAPGVRHEERVGRGDLLQAVEDALSGGMNRKLRRRESFVAANYDLPTESGREGLGVLALPVGQEGAAVAVYETAPSPQGVMVLEEVLMVVAHLVPLWEAAEQTAALDQTKEELSAREVAFATNVSHELRTPLTNLVGYLKTMKRRVDEQGGELLGIAEQEAGKLQRLVDGFQEFLRTEKKETKVQVETFDAAEALRGLVAVHQEFATGDRPLHADVPGHLSVNFDPELFHAVFSELLENARKYGDGATEVRLWQEAEPAVARLSVRDHGPGVTGEALPSIFDRFYKAHRPDAYNAGGTGLGLYVARERVRQAGGELEGQNSGEGGFLAVLTMPLSGAAGVDGGGA